MRPLCQPRPRGMLRSRRGPGGPADERGALVDPQRAACYAHAARAAVLQDDRCSKRKDRNRAGRRCGEGGACRHGACSREGLCQATPASGRPLGPIAQSKSNCAYLLVQVIFYADVNAHGAGRFHRRRTMQGRIVVAAHDSEYLATFHTPSTALSLGQPTGYAREKVSPS